MVSAACHSRAVTNADGRCSYTEMFLHGDVPACPVNHAARWERVMVTITTEGRASMHTPQEHAGTSPSARVAHSWVKALSDGDNLDVKLG